MILDEICKRKVTKDEKKKKKKKAGFPYKGIMAGVPLHILCQIIRDL